MMFHINTARINYVQLCQLSIARRATRGKEGSQTIAYTTLLETPLLEHIKLPAKLLNFPYDVLHATSVNSATSQTRYCDDVL